MQITDAVRQVETTLGFFASVIKSGEPWTSTCQKEYDSARAALTAALAAAPAPAGEEVDVDLEIACNGLKRVFCEAKETEHVVAAVSALNLLRRLSAELAAAEAARDAALARAQAAEAALAETENWIASLGTDSVELTEAPTDD